MTETQSAQREEGGAGGKSECRCREDDSELLTGFRSADKRRRRLWSCLGVSEHPLEELLTSHTRSASVCFYHQHFQVKPQRVDQTINNGFILLLGQKTQTVKCLQHGLESKDGFDFSLRNH
ncbi:Hypothetical protein SMAX5B_003625 [Scophthalmus maximus]|uniref:Uncharacterized protein n=1 Tax=Scophthalmus maximus TaxID=52904 RepID=A0A2U9AX20_SCOMX|nr:Hypothetical protein SMAX5B_003625 [Scophthalmus maximus]